MKQALFSVYFFLVIHFVSAQTWTWSADQPKPGQDITVTVRDIDMDHDIHIVGYYFQGKDLVSSDINYIVDNDALKMTLKVPENTNWLRLVVKDENNEALAGDHKDIIVPGAPAGASMIDFANATSAYYRLMGLEKDDETLTKMYRDAVTDYPGWLDNATVLRQYFLVAKAAKSQEDLGKISSFITACEQKPDGLSQEILISAIRIAKDSGDSILFASLRRKLDTMYPQSIISQEEQFAQFRKATALADRITLREKFKSTYPITDMNRGMYDQMTATIIDECAKSNDWKKVDEYLTDIQDPTTKARICNSYAWTLAGEGLDKEPSQLELAEKFSSASMNLLSEGTVPRASTPIEWKNTIDSWRAMYGDTYALVLFKQGKYDEAIQHQHFAIEKFRYEDPEMNERYAVYLEKANRQEEALSFIEDMIRDGKASPNMKAAHERLWLTKSQEQLYDRYVAELESVAKARRLEEIRAMWMDDATASSFTLTDLNGKQVTLSDFKGKTVVLDFWATWCGPCKASFPGMKNAVEHFAADKDVVFLFVDTWENGDNIQDKVKKFITENNYPFHVLMDSKNQVVEQYKVEGIPTKFIIAPDQKVRFKSVGYGGNNDVLVEELITMIEMARNNGKLTKS